MTATLDFNYGLSTRIEEIENGYSVTVMGVARNPNTGAPIQISKTWSYDTKEKARMRYLNAMDRSEPYPNEETEQPTVPPLAAPEA